MQQVRMNPCSKYQGSVGGCGVDKKAEQEMLLLIANIYHILAFVCLALVAQAISTTFAINMVRALLMSPKKEMKKFTRMKPHSLPRDNRSVDYRTCKCQGRSWTSSSSCGGSVLGFPQYGSSCLWMEEELKNCQLLSMFCVQPKLCSGKVHTRVQQADS